MLLFRKMLHCKDGSWLACVSAEKLTEVRLCSVRAARLRFPAHCAGLVGAGNESARSRGAPNSQLLLGRAESDLTLTLHY
jgi:hypothetical protein